MGAQLDSDEYLYSMLTFLLRNNTTHQTMQFIKNQFPFKDESITAAH